jgi:hypothetical protein
MVAAVLLSLALPSAVHGLVTSGLSNDQIVAIALREQPFSRERRGRKLLAECSHVPRLAGKTREAAVEFSREAVALIFDPEKLSNAGEWEFELELARAASLAGQGLPFPLVEGEEKSVAEEITYALEKAGDDKKFAEKFRAALSAGKKAVDAERRLGLPAVRPRGAVEGTGYFAARLEDSVDGFVRAVESAALTDPDTVRFTALADFVEQYGPEYQDVALADGASFARAGQKRYSAALYRAARLVSASGGTAGVREALGPLETQTLPELRRRLEKFR